MFAAVTVGQFYRGCASLRARPVSEISASSSTFIHIKDYLATYLIMNHPRPPYNHVCQIGDPVLRIPAQLVAPERIRTPEIQKIINTMQTTMKRYGTLGLAAPQIGESVQIFMIEISEKYVEDIEKEVAKCYGIEVVPLKTFINPSLKVLDFTKIMSEEACASIRGFTATVPRFQKVEVKGLDHSGKEVTWIAQDFVACVIQHEFDHLLGKMYTDKMDASSFCYDDWHRINRFRGIVKMPFYPRLFNLKEKFLRLVARFIKK